MLSDFWRDFIALFGLALTMIALVYAIIQIRMTKSAAKAAEDAAKKTLNENQLSFLRFMASNANRYFNETKTHIDNQEWEKAALRLNDVADQVAQLAALDPEWLRFVEELRIWSAKCRRLAKRELTRFTKSKWLSFHVLLQSRIDSCHGPFRGASEELPDDTSREIP